MRDSKITNGPTLICCSITNIRTLVTPLMVVLKIERNRTAKIYYEALK